MKKSTETPKPPTSEQIVRAACDVETEIAAGWIEAGPDGDGDDPAPGVGITTPEANELRAKQEEALAAKDRQNAAESWERSDTDGFLSQWASGLSANMHTAQAQIERDGGLAEFDAIFTVDGEWVPAKTFEGLWGTRWMILDDEGRAIGTFLPFKPVRRSTLAKKGYVEGRVLRPAKAKITGTGYGLSGPAWVAVFPTDRDTNPPAKILCRDRWKEEEDIAHDKEITQAAGANNPTVSSNKENAMKTIEELRRALEGGATHMLDRTVAGRILTIGELKDEIAYLEATRDVAA